MKKSLGRRSSSRNPSRTLFTDFESARKDRRSGIPVRAVSIDRNLNSLATPRNRAMVTPSTKRSTSEDRNSMIFNPICWTGGMERPPRSATSSTSSARHSSYGGARSKRDNRPIEDKDWQIVTQRKIENFLMEDEHGCHILSNGSIKPMTLKLFLSITDLLLKKVFGNYERTFLHKDNYISEFPFYMKKLYYRGKVEKSWLITVNTTRSWCHVLASFDFLATCVTSQSVLDADALLFPEKYEEDDDFWNYPVVLPYLRNSYELYKANDPLYEEKQEQLDRALIQHHLSDDNAQEKIENIKADIEKIRQDTEGITKRLEKCSIALKPLDETLNNLKERKCQYEEFLKDMIDHIEELKIKIEQKEKRIQLLMDELNRKQQVKLGLEKEIDFQQFSVKELESLKKKRDSLQRNIEIENDYVAGFEELLQKTSIEILSRKKELQNTVKTYNMEIMKYFAYGLENTMIDAKLTEEEINQALESVKKTINASKHELQGLLASPSVESLSKAKEELKSLENQVSEMSNTLTKLNEDYQNKLREAEEVVISQKNQVEVIMNKLGGISEECFQDKLSHIKEKEIRADKMEKQLSMYKSNVFHIATECSGLIEEYSNKYKELFEEFKKKIEEKGK